MPLSGLEWPLQLFETFLNRISWKI